MPSQKASPTHTELLTKAAQSYPDKWALSAGKLEISHSDQELIAVLPSAGVSPGDVVVLPFPNSITMVIMFQEVMPARGVAVPLDPANTQEGLEVYLFLSESKLLLTDSNGYPPAQAAASKLGITQATVSLPDPTGPVHISVPTLNGDSTPGLVHGFSNDPSDGVLLLHNSDVGVPISVLAEDISPPEDSEHNTGSGPIGLEVSQPNQTSQPGIADPTPGPNRSNGIWHLMSTARNFFSNAGSGPTDLEAGQPNQTPRPEIADPTPGPNRSNGIWHLRCTAALNFVSNTMVGVLFLGKKLRGSNETYQRAELIASVGVPIAVAAGTFVASFLFASNPGRWSNWISGMSMINAGMTVGGPLSFNWVHN